MRRDPIPAGLQAIIDKALQKKPEDRYQKISAMRDDLNAIMQQISGGVGMPGETIVPTHAEGGVFRRAISWITGKSISEARPEEAVFQIRLHSFPNSASPPLLPAPKKRALLSYLSKILARTQILISTSLHLPMPL